MTSSAAKVKHVDKDYNETTFPFTKDGVNYSIIFRAYDEGVCPALCDRRKRR